MSYQKELHEGKLGFSQKELNELFIYRMLLENGTLYPAQIYGAMTEDMPFKKRARSYVYKCMNQLAAGGFIKVETEEKKKTFYSITEKGKQTYQAFYDQHIKKIKNVKQVVQHMIIDITKRSPEDTSFVITSDDRQFLSKVINIREWVRYLMLRELLHTKTKHIHGHYIYQMMEKRYGWQASSGYFYEILRKMDKPQKYDPESQEFPLVTSKWSDPDSRHYRIYYINENGKRTLALLEESVLTHLKHVRTYISNILHCLDINRK